MICWMIFSCKYAERNLEMLGNKEEEKMSGLQELLEGLQTLETVLGGTWIDAWMYSTFNVTVIWVHDKNSGL